MRVLHVVRQYYPSVGGMERVVAALCQHLSAQGHECSVATLNRLWGDRDRRLAAKDVVAGVPVVRLPFAGGRRFFVPRGLLAVVKAYDIVHIHGVDSFLDFLALTPRKHRPPLVVSTHGGFFHTPWAWQIKRLYFHTITRVAMARVERVLCVSRQDLQRFARIVPADRLEVMGNGVDPAFSRIRNAPTPGLIVSVGRMAANKRLDRLIEVFAAVHSQVSEARLVLIGPDGERLLPALRSRAARLGISDYVEFDGVLRDSALHERLARAHVFVTASAYEAFGIAVIEALAAGVVVVASDIDAFREVITHGENGFLADFENVSAAAQVVLTAMHLSEAERLHIGGRARETAAAYCWDRVAARLEHVYRETLDKWHGRHCR